MTTYRVVSRDGSTTFISAYTQSDAYEQAFNFAEPKGGILEFGEA